MTAVLLAVVMIVELPRDAGPVNVMADWCSKRVAATYIHPYQEQVISVEIQEGITSIESATFYGCINLTSIEIPSGVTSIGDSAFGGCDDLENVTMQPTVPPVLGEAVTFSVTAAGEGMTEETKKAISLLFFFKSEIIISL